MNAPRPEPAGLPNPFYTGGLPNMDNGGRWDHISSDAEVKRALKAGNMRVYEIDALCITMLISYRHLTIVRALAMGGDENTVQGGWTYGNDIALRLDEMEIASLMRTMGGRVVVS